MKKYRIFRIMPIFIMVALLVSVSGCGTKQEPANVNKEKLVEKQAVKTFTVGVALASATNPFYVGMDKGIKAAAERNKIEIRTVIANEDQSRQVNGVQDLITANVDAIIISPISTEGAVIAYEAAKKASIPIISVARTIKKPELEASYVGINIYEDGKRIAEWLAKKLNGKGKVAMLKGVAGASFTMDLVRGFKEVMSKYPDIQIVAEVNSPITKEAGLQNTENILTANPELNAIFAANDELALGAVQAAETAGRLNKLLISGYNGVPTAMQSIEDGKLAMTVALRPQHLGELSTETVLEILNGGKVSQQVFNETLLIDQEQLKSLKPEELK